MTFKPMLAAGIEEMSKLKYPLLASFKYDGIRATMQGGVLLSRTLKPIPNENIQEMFKGLPEGIDGEFIFGDPTAKDVFQLTTSVVMSHHKQAAGIKFYAFDLYSSKPFEQREQDLYEEIFISDYDNVEQVQQVKIDNEKQLLIFEQLALDKGYEGLILRSPSSPYKEGRSTEKQGWLLKLKRFVDAEAEIIGYDEEMENTNEATTNALGRTERSSAKAGMVGKDRLGKFIVIGINGDFKGVEFGVGSGLTADQREKYWRLQKTLKGKIIKYKYFPIGTKDAPRLPIFLGFRDKADM